MKVPIFDPKYWRMRLHSASAPHQILCICGEEYWKATEESHRNRLAKEIRVNDRVLDAGCAYGRLIDLMPETWKGPYVGIDISPDFIDKAKTDYPAKRYQFSVGDLRKLEYFPNKSFDVAVCISIKQMVADNMGIEEWNLMEAELNRVSYKLLILEYGE